LSAWVSRIANSNLIGACVALALAALLVMKATAAFPSQFGIDFYQFWGVPLAKKVSAMPRSPYVDPPGYASVLNAMSDASGSRKLHEANAARRNLEPMGTPFLYATFSIFPDDFDQAQVVFASLLYLAAGLGVFVLARLRGVPQWPAIWISILVELTFRPFLLDAKVENVNSLQLAFIAALLHVAVKRRYSGHALVDGLFLGFLAVFVIFKPNTPWIALAFAAHYWFTQGSRRFFVGAGVAAILTGLAFAAGAWFFQDAAVWGEWLQFARGMDGTGLALTLAQGNVSLAMLWAQQSRSYGPVGYGLIIAIALSLALVVAMSSGGRGANLLVATVRKVFSDPWFAASIGVVFTFATSPLVWPHYHVLALVPIFWLSGVDSRANVCRWGALICYVTLSEPFFELLFATGFYGTIQATMLLSWVALVPGVFSYVAQQHRALQAAAT
jgi:Glycosyltransferase family 87